MKENDFNHDDAIFMKGGHHGEQGGGFTVEYYASINSHILKGLEKQGKTVVGLKFEGHEIGVILK